MATRSGNWPAAVALLARAVPAAWTGLAMRAPEGDPFPGISAVRGLPRGADRSAAPAAGPAWPPVHPGFRASLPPACSYLAGPVLVRVKQPAGQADQRSQVAAGADWLIPRRNSTSHL